MSGAMKFLKTDAGDREVYDAVSQCSRCGWCLQACPTFVATGKEAYSGRGRNQVVRMMLEEKLKDPASAGDALSTCLLCGACTSACYAHVPTADLVLEGRRALRGGREPLAVRLITGLLLDRPRLGAWLLRAANLLKRLGLARLVSWSRLLRLVGLRALETAELQVREAPLRFLSESLRADPSLAGASGGSGATRWHYFAACGPNYVLPRVGLATTRLLRAVRGPGRFLDNPCCGLLAYNYGSLDSARAFARRNIENWESRALVGAEADQQAPIVGDCSSCVAHLKSYEQLFLEDPGWRPRAARFAAAVKDAIEAVPEDALPRLKGFAGTATYHDSCRARHGQGLVDPPRRLLSRLLGERYAELPEAEGCCGGAGAFSLAHPELSDAIAKRKAGNIASVRADLVLTSSTSCLLQLDHALRKYYPTARVRHLSEFLAEHATAER